MSALGKLWANQVISGKKTFKQVPNGLKKEVAGILINSGYENLVPDEYK